MSLPFQFRRRVYDSKEVNTLQDEIEQSLRDFVAGSISNGRLIEDVSLTTGQANRIGHRLGRAPRGVIPVLLSADARVWVVEKGKNEIDVRCSANVTASLWVF